MFLEVFLLESVKEILQKSFKTIKRPGCHLKKSQLTAIIVFQAQ